MGDILITDDEADIRSLIADILEDEGYSCRKVGTADQCMSAIEDEAPSLMILDIWLKGSDMDGPPGYSDHHHFGPWQHRDRGRRHQARGLRLHRKTLQHRPVDGCRGPGDGNLASAPGEQ